MIKRQIKLNLFPIVAIVLFLFSACQQSNHSRNEQLDAQKEQWVNEMKDAFPDKTSDTLELKKRLDYFNETGNKIGQLMMYRVLGNEARHNSQFRSAIKSHTLGLQIAYEINDTINITVVMNDLATDFRRIGAFDEAAPYHYLALQFAENYRGKDTTLMERNMASAYNGIGSIYRAMNEYDEAVRVYKKALQLEEKHENHRGIAINYANIGAIHFDKEEYDQAEMYYNISLENNIKAKLPMGVALCRINIGSLHEVQGDLDKALVQFEQAYSVLANTSDRWHWLDACFQMANIHIKKESYAKASQYLHAGLQTAQEINSLKHLQKAHELLSIYHYERGNYKQSIDNMRNMQTYSKMQQHNLEADRLLESRVKYETEKFTKQIDELNELNREQTIKRKNTMLLLIPLLVALFALVMLLIYKQRLERKQAVELQNLERMRSNFFTNITHEFRTPITVINGLSEHLRSTIIDDNGIESLNAILRQGNQLMHLVNQLLDFSRSEAGVSKPKWRYGDMAEYLRVIAESYMQYARNKGIELFIYCETDSLYMNFVPSYIKKVMGNLLSNSLKHCKEGDQIVVHFKYDQADKQCIIQVKDTGEGISAEDMPNIFELYYTSESNTSKQKGSGIGLALSKQLVEEIKGTIRVTSTPYKNTEFILTLPVSNTPITDSDLEHIEEEDPNLYDSRFENNEYSLENKTTNGKKTLLIVEDNKDVAHYISTILSDKYSLLYAVNGNEGLLMAEQHIPDLIITDVMMPEKDGYRFTEELRTSLAVSHIPVIMITAKGTTEDLLEGLKVGADAYLSKPFDERELLARIKQLLDSRVMLMETYSNVLLQENKNTGSNPDHNMVFISKLSTVVNNHLNNSSYFPDGLAQDMCLSESQLNRKLKAMTGHTITSFVMRARLNKAKQMLAKREKSIKDVAFSCGFSDMSYFSRSFKKAFGLTPSEYIKIPEQQDR